MFRGYQTEAADSVFAAYKRGLQRVLVVLPTGMGKTVLFAGCTRAVLTPGALGGIGGDGAVLILTHTDELVEQARDTVRRVAPSFRIGIERSGERADPSCQVIIASVASAAGKRLERLVAALEDRLRLIVVDEAHRSAAYTYRKVVRRLLDAAPRARLLGVTATPERTDRVSLGTIYQEIVYQMLLPEAIEGGWLVPLHGWRVRTDVELPLPRASNDSDEDGDFNDDELARYLDVARRNALIVATHRRLGGARTIVFVSTIAHAEHVAAAFRKADVRAVAVSGETPTRERTTIVQRFRAGDVDVLVNVGVFVHGFDVPEVDLVILGRPTRSIGLLSQQVGRGTRPHGSIATRLGALASSEERRALIAASAKTHATIVDLVDAIADDGIVTSSSLFGLPPIDGQGFDLGSLAEAERRRPPAALPAPEEPARESDWVDPRLLAILDGDGADRLASELELSEVALFRDGQRTRIPVRGPGNPTQLDFDWDDLSA